MCQHVFVISTGSHKIDLFPLVKWTLVHETPLTGTCWIMLVCWCCNGFQPLPCGQTWCLQLCLLVTLTSRIKCCRWPNWNGANCIFLPQCKDVWSSLVYDVYRYTYIYTFKTFSMPSSFWLKNSFCKAVVCHKIHSNNSRDPGHILTFWLDGKLMLWSFA